MRLRVVTITGADNNTEVAQLADNSCRFHFVEWGILLSSSAHKHGKSRCPNATWLETLKKRHTSDMKLSGHICGHWAKQVCRGVFPADIDIDLFQRIQLNIGDEEYLNEIVDINKMADCLPKCREYVVQVGLPASRGLYVARTLLYARVNVSVLFDASRGRGIPPISWPDPPRDFPCGFAGGLGPDNLSYELERLDAIVGCRRIWIDMESKVRTEDHLDFGKVDECLKIAERFVR